MGRSTGHGQLDALQPKQFLPELAVKQWISIRHQGGWYAMKMDNILDEDFGNKGRSKVGWQGREISLFGQAINNYKDVCLA